MGEVSKDIGKLRVHTVAKMMKVSPSVVIDILAKMNIHVTSHLSSLNDDIIQQIKDRHLIKSGVAKEKVFKSSTDTTDKKTYNKPFKKPDNKTGSSGHRNFKYNNNRNNPNIKKDSKQQNTKNAKARQRNIKHGLQKTIELIKNSTLLDVANKLNVPISKIIDILPESNDYTHNTSVDDNLRNIISRNFNCKISLLDFNREYIDLFNKYNIVLSDNPVTENSIKRPPIIVVLGHVDHGKTSLLDKLRNTNVVSQEHGNITQHIGAYQILYTYEDKERHITFLDTPGHELFTKIRMRGAAITDIAILVVAADDGVKAQTLEAIEHIKNNNINVVVAINKIDKPYSDIDKVKSQLAEVGIVPEEYGGEHICVGISAKTGEGIQELLDSVLLLYDVAVDGKTDIKRDVSGIVLESKMTKEYGALSTLIVRHGVLKPGDIIVCGNIHGRIRRMHDAFGNVLSNASSSVPVSVSGLPLLSAGDRWYGVKNTNIAKNISSKFDQISKKIALHDEKTQHASRMYDFGQGNFIEEDINSIISLIIKCDVYGSLEALSSALQNQSPQYNKKVRIIKSSIGNITEDDINLAVSTKAIIFGLNVNFDKQIKNAITSYDVEIYTDKVIYKLLDKFDELFSGKQAEEKEIIGSCTIKAIFSSSKNKYLVGGYVDSGRLKVNDKLSVIREEENIANFILLESLRKFKDNVNFINSGSECGLSITNCNKYTPNVGDILVVYKS